MELTAQKRAPGDAKGLRKEGNLPGIVYNKDTNIPVSVELRAFDKVFRSQGTSNIIDLNVDGENHEVLVRAVQMNKRRRLPQHVDFYQIIAGQMVEVAVNIDLVGTPQGVKDGGLMDVQRREIRINILPRLIPDAVELDVSELTIGDSLHMSDVAAKLPEEAEILDELERTIVTVVPPRIEEEPEVADDAVEPELIGREGEEGEEGEASEASGDDDAGDDD